jgi:hypothetical protein
MHLDKTENKFLLEKCNELLYCEITSNKPYSWLVTTIIIRLFHVLDQAVKLFQCLIKHFSIKAWKSGGIAPFILNLDTSGGECPASPFVLFTTRKTNSVSFVQAIAWALGTVYIF